MKISQEQKRKLKEFLGSEVYQANEQSEIRKVKDTVSNMETGISKSVSEGLKELNKKISKIQNTDMTPVIEALNRMADKIIESKPADMSGFFKDFAVQIAETGDSTKKTKELIQTLKWNSTMGIKNRSGTPISPSVSPFQVSDYDNVVLSNYNGTGGPGTVIYYLGTQAIKTLTITYDGSGNILTVTSV